MRFLTHTYFMTTLNNERISLIDPWVGANDVPTWTLGDRMRKALRHADISVGAMAVDLGVNPATVGRWLSDRTPVKRQTLKVWALTCGVDLEWLETGQAPNESGPDGGALYTPSDSNREPAD